jgi:hypothetical protein
MVAMSIILNDEVNVLGTMKHFDHSQPGSLHFELVAYVVPIMRPLEPCSFVPLPFGGKSVSLQLLLHP